MVKIILQNPWTPAIEFIAPHAYDLMANAVYKYNTYQRSFAHLNKRQTRHVVVIGAGQGGIVNAAAEAGIPPEQISAIEHNPAAFRVLTEKFPRVNAVLGNACHVAVWQQLRELYAEPPTVIAMEMMGSLACSEAMPEVAVGANRCVEAVWGELGKHVIYIPNRLVVLCLRSHEFPEAERLLRNDPAVKVAAGLELNWDQWNELMPVWEFDVGKEFEKIMEAEVPGEKGVLVFSFIAYLHGDEKLCGAHGGLQEGRNGLTNEWYPAIMNGKKGNSLRRISWGFTPAYLLR